MDWRGMILQSKRRLTGGFKQDEEGVAKMCKIMEDMRNEAAREAEQNKTKKTAVHLIKLGKMSLEEIAEATELSLDIVRDLEN